MERYAEMQNNLLQQYKEEEETGKSMTQQGRNVTFEENKRSITQEIVNEEDQATERNQ